MYRFVKEYNLNYANILVKNISLLIIVIFLTCQSSSGQSLLKKFSKLSSPEKCWVILHPFKAKRAFRISILAEHATDSIFKTNLQDNDRNGGQVDAFRHAFWMAMLAQKIGKRSAKNLGKAHEKGNYKQFKKNKLEDGTLPDAPSSKMDLHNNNIGIETYKANKKATRIEYISLILKKIKSGELKILKKDRKGNYLDCKGNLISTLKYKGLWENTKCLIPSKK